MDRESYVNTVEYAQRVYLYLEEDSVLVRPSFSGDEGTCGRVELIEECAAFGLRVYDAFVSEIPHARDNGILDSWYPLDEMKRIVHGK